MNPKMGIAGSEACSSSSSTTSTTGAPPPPPPASSPSPSGKRSRDPEDEVYVDNLHSHKRYLSEIMASSLNGLTVGDTLPDNLMDSSSPVTADNLFFLRDDMILQYSPMSEDSEDSRYSEPPMTTCSSQPESRPTSPVSPYRYQMTTCPSQPESRPTSPVSPYRYQRPMSSFSYAPSTSSNALHCSSLPSVSSSQPRPRDSEGRFPSSPSDICHSGDLRRTALLRSVQMRTQPPGSASMELPLCPGQQSAHNMITEERPCSFLKSLIDERDYPVEECASFNITDPEYNQDTSCGVPDMDTKEDRHKEKIL